MEYCFKNQRVVQLIVTDSQGKKFFLKGTAKGIGKSLLEVIIPEEDAPETDIITTQSKILINFESREGIISLWTSLERILEKGRFVLNILEYKKDSSDIESLRVSGAKVKAIYFHLSQTDQQKNQTSKETKVINISPKGILIRCDEVIEPYKVIGLEITLPTKVRQTLQCTAKVARMTLTASGKIDLGLKFLDLDQTQQNRLLDFCQDNA